MFYAFSRFHRPKDYIAARTRLLAWAARSPHWAYLQDGPPDVRSLTEPELRWLEDLTDTAWQGTAFGGFLASDAQSEIQGYVHFELDEPQLNARLLAWLEEPPAGRTLTPAEGPGLPAGLTDLLREIPQLETVELGPVQPAPDIIRLMAGLDLEPDEQLGRWRVIYEAEPVEPERSETPSESPSGVQNWLELSVQAEPEAVEAITELFARYGYNQGVVIEEPVQPGPDGGAVRDPAGPVTVRTYVPAGQADESGIKKLREGLFYLGRLRRIEELQLKELREADWANAWKEFYQVHRVGKRTLIKPPWQEYVAQPEDIVVEIDPGMAFGTGLHPTTRLCLQLLEDHVEPARHQKLLDLGSGSGILAIAAARLGIPYVLGVDTDEVAVRAARENVVRNGLEQQIAMETGSLAVETDAPAAGGFYAFSPAAQRPPAQLTANLPFDVVVANIIARVLVALAEPLAAALRPGGLLITSGIIAERAEEVDRALQAAGLELIERREESDWVAFAHKKV